MTKLGLIAASVLALAGPAMAQDDYPPRARAKPHVAVANPDPSLPIENALRWGYSQGYSNYPSGWGGLYGDGRYPGNVVSNRGPGNSRP
jgi:hypothetical protein